MRKTKKTERLFTPVHSIKEYLELLSSHGDKPLYGYVENSEYLSMTYKEFYELTLNVAAGLKSIDLVGKRVAVIGDTSPQWVAAYLAVMASGGVVIPMDKELDVTAIEGLLSSVDAEGIIYSKTFNDKFAEARKSHPSLKKFIAISPADTDENVISYESVAEAGKAARENNPFEITERSVEELAIMLFTSGTTGTSKCVMLCEKNLWSTVNAACQTVNFYPDDVIVSVLPIHHTYELAVMLSALDYGMQVGINDSLRHVMKNFAKFAPTGLVLVPLFVNTIYSRIMAKAKASGKEKLLKVMMKVSNALRCVGIDLRRKFFKEVLSAFGGNLCKIVSGGAPLNPEMMKQFDAFGITIAEGYGITECSPLISVNPYYALKVGSVGPAVPSCTVRIGDSTGKNDKGFDEGEIQVKGDNVMLGYYNNDEENAKAFTSDGWYRTGDIGYMDKDGYIYITGRLKSVIVLENGKNVFPEEIEEYLSNIEEIGESVVVGRVGDDGETINLTALVYPNTEIFGESFDKDAAYEAIHKKILDLNRRMPSFKVIKALEIREEPFEKTTSRKIKRHLVK